MNPEGMKMVFIINVMYLVELANECQEPGAGRKLLLFRLYETEA